MRLHGTIAVDERAADWEELERPAPDDVVVDGVELRRAQPRAAAAQRRAATSSTSRWRGGRRSSRGSSRTWRATSQLAVIVDDDPGRDLGEAPPARPPLLLRARRGRAARATRVGAHAHPRRRHRQRVPGRRRLRRRAGRAARAARAARGRRGRRLRHPRDGPRLRAAATATTPSCCSTRRRAASAPGTLYVIEPEPSARRRRAVDAHGMDPVKVLALARDAGRRRCRARSSSAASRDPDEPDEEDESSPSSASPCAPRSTRARGSSSRCWTN